jgi:MFS family permease
MIKNLPRAVIVLGFASLLNDGASEMITPLIPVFLTATLGAGPAIVGLVEGLADTVSSVLKLIAGRLVDAGVRPKRLVVFGYGLANFARPLMGFASSWPFVLFLRVTDRIGKGIRTAPRDALLAGSVPAAMRGRAFGFHRSMDHTGAVIGPLLAFGLLSAQVPLRHVFLYSGVIGAILLLVVGFGIPKDAAALRDAPMMRFSWRALDVRVRILVSAAGALAFAAVPETFVVLWAREHGLALHWVPIVWAAASLAKVLIAMPAGILADRVGHLPVLIGGWTLRVAALAALALFPARGPAVWVLFAAYSATLATTEPSERAFIGNHVPTTQRGTAYGLYYLLCGLMALPGALAFGALWQAFGSHVAFVAASVLTATAAVWVLFAARAQIPREN